MMMMNKIKSIIKFFTCDVLNFKILDLFFLFVVNCKYNKSHNRIYISIKTKTKQKQNYNKKKQKALVVNIFYYIKRKFGTDCLLCRTLKRVRE